MSIQPTTGLSNQYPPPVPQEQRMVRKTKEDDPNPKLKEAREAAEQKAEQSRRLGPPVDIKDPREIMARVIGRRNPAASANSKDRRKDTTDASSKSAGPQSSKSRDIVELRADRSRAERH